MRRKLVLGVGLAALVGSTAVGQFASDRPAVPSPPTSLPVRTPLSTPKVGPAASGAPSGFQPLTPPTSPTSPTPPSSPTTPGYTPLYGPAPTNTGAYVPPTDGLRPANYEAPAGGYRTTPSFTAIPVSAEIPTALPTDHPWLLKPDHGPWFILVKSYVRPSQDSRAVREGFDRGESAKQLAEGLASEIRDTFRVQAFLYEYISDERKTEMQAIIAAKQKAANEYVRQISALEEKAKLQGIDFLRPDNKLHIMRHDSRDQIGVLVGGFQTEADAIKALAILKKWPAPKNEQLMDGGAIVKPGPDGKQIIEKTRLNPYASAFVVPNPASMRATQPNAQRATLDPFLVKLNEGNPYSLLKATKGWTLTVKSFSSPVEIVNKNSDTSLMRKFGFAKGGDVLAAGAEQAEAMAKALRAMKGAGGQSLNLEAFVMHTRSASLVTVGQFDGPDDPALHATWRLLAGMKLHATEDATGMRPATNAPTLFDKVLPMPIPKP